jgi:hypothetical protein
MHRGGDFWKIRSIWQVSMQRRHAVQQAAERESKKEKVPKKENPPERKERHLLPCAFGSASVSAFSLTCPSAAWLDSRSIGTACLRCIDTASSCSFQTPSGVALLFSHANLPAEEV